MPDSTEDIVLADVALEPGDHSAAGILFDPNDLIRVLVGRVREYDLMFQVLSS